VNEQDLAYGVASFTGTNTTGYPDQLFITEIFSKYRNRISQTWDFPVSTAGTYTINLLFAEIWEEAQEPGKRVFGISIEDSVVADSVDLVADPGWNIAVVKTYNIEVTDGNIEINFLRGIQNPAI
jgi:hypothetical protein